MANELDKPLGTVDNTTILRDPEATEVDTNGGGTGSSVNRSEQKDQAAKLGDLVLPYFCLKRPSPQETPQGAKGGAGGAGACEDDDVHFWDKESLSVYMNPKEILELTRRKWSYKGHLISCPTIAAIAQEWNDTKDVPEMEYVPKLKFVYDAGQMNNCDIRVKFSETETNNTWVGTRAQSDRNHHEPTMYLNLSEGEDRHKRHLILHEFGHALGLQHEHQSRNFPSQFIDLDKVKQDVESKGYELRDWMMEGQYAKASDYDADSIMHYWIEDRWLKQGCSSKEPLDRNLSQEDITLLKKLHRRINILPDEISKQDKEWIGKKYKEVRGVPTMQDEDNAPTGYEYKPSLFGV